MTAIIIKGSGYLWRIEAAWTFFKFGLAALIPRSTVTLKITDRA